MQNYRDLKVWQKAHEFVKEVYSVTKNFPSDEKFGITSQLRRASVSIPTNIAEGSAQTTDPQFARFLGIAYASAVECEYLIFLSLDLSYISKVEPDSNGIVFKINEIKRMLTAFMEKVR